MDSAPLHVESVLALAPDVPAAKVARTLARVPSWQLLGMNAHAVWGEFKGSTLYQVRASIHDLGFKCTCPSHKQPCKHALALLLLAAQQGGDLPQADPPGWVTDWLSQREKRAAARQERAQASSGPDVKAQARRAERRKEQVDVGLDSLELWSQDIIRQGLAALGSQRKAFWDAQAARLVDAQAPALAARVRRIGELVHTSANWPERVLAELGKLTLLVQAYRSIDTLDPPLQADVRHSIGWTLTKEAVLTQGDHVNDHWLVVSQRTYVEDRLRVRRTWLQGVNTRRDALELSYAANGATFDKIGKPGQLVWGTMAFWPSACPQRALLCDGAIVSSSQPVGLGGAVSVGRFLDQVSLKLSHQPWLDLFPCTLHSVTPVRLGADRWVIAETSNQALPLSKGEHWRLLAVSGGQPLDLAGEWDGTSLAPHAALIDGALYRLIEDS